MEKVVKKDEDMNLKFEKESIPKLLFRLAIPAITAQLVNALYNMVDRMYIGRIAEIGTDALTGVGLTFPLIMIVSAFAAMIGMGGAPIASISMGEGNDERAKKVINSCFTMLLAFSAILTFGLIPFLEPMLLTFGASQKTLPYAVDYMIIYLSGTIFVQLALGLNSFISAQGFAKMSMFTVIIGAISNIVLDPILIFGLNMGVKGAALATVISQGISAIYVLNFLIRSPKNKLKINIKKIGIDWNIAKRVIPLGLAPFIMQSTESLLQITFNRSLQIYGGDLYVGAMVILSSAMQFCMMPLMGITQGAQPIISYNYGAKNYDRVKKTVVCALSGGTVFVVAVWLIAMFSPDWISSIFSQDLALKKIANESMRIYFAGACIFSAQIIFQNAFIAIGYAKTSIFLALLRKILLLIPLILILPHFITPGTTGVFMAEPISDIIACVVTTITFLVVAKKSLKEPKQEIEKI